MVWRLRSECFGNGHDLVICSSMVDGMDWRGSQWTSFLYHGWEEIISGHGNLIEVECTEVKQTWREYLVS